MVGDEGRGRDAENQPETDRQTRSELEKKMSSCDWYRLTVNHQLRRASVNELLMNTGACSETAKHTCQTFASYIRVHAPLSARGPFPRESRFLCSKGNKKGRSPSLAVLTARSCLCVDSRSYITLSSMLKGALPCETECFKELSAR